MIFVTVGMHSQGFDRLIKKMDEIASRIDEEVIMQIGSTKYKPRTAKYFEFTNDFQKILELNREARLVICHGGAGTIITALDQGKPVIAVPRLKRYNEHFDDHQLELIDALANDRKIIAVYDIKELEKAINNPFVDIPTESKKDEILVRSLREYINGLNR